MGTRKKWSREEDRVLIDKVSRSPQCLYKAFENAARILERTPNSCRLRWYNHTSKHESVAFTLISSKIATVNSKGKTKSNRSKEVNRSFWKKIKDFFIR